MPKIFGHDGKLPRSRNSCDGDIGKAWVTADCDRGVRYFTGMISRFGIKRQNPVGETGPQVRDPSVQQFSSSRRTLAAQLADTAPQLRQDHDRYEQPGLSRPESLGGPMVERRASRRQL